MGTYGSLAAPRRPAALRRCAAWATLWAMQKGSSSLPHALCAMPIMLACAAPVRAEDEVSVLGDGIAAYGRGDFAATMARLRGPAERGSASACART